MENLNFAIISYGKLGGKELGYASDLDLVYIFASFIFLIIYEENKNVNTFLKTFLKNFLINVCKYIMFIFTCIIH